jgi:site-specific DNA-adenine methylase
MPRPVRVLNYYGSKVNSAHRYPEPQHELIVEPFAGGAGYSLRHRTKKVVLFDYSADVVSAWQWLIKAPQEHILELPLLQPGEEVPAHLPHGARCLIGFATMLIGARPQMQMVPCSARVPSSFWGANRRAALAELAPQIKHWQAHLGHYSTIPEYPVATWFIDPPYQGPAGNHYRYGVDYTHLAEWCRSRPGQVIVCEAPGADWLPFTETHLVRAAPRAGTAGRPQAREAMWIRP